MAACAALPTAEGFSTQVSQETAPYIAKCGFEGCAQCPKDCDGCLASNKGKVAVTAQYCRVRTCAFERGAENCAYCNDYSCSKLRRLYSRWKKSGNKEAAKKAKETLDKIREKLG